MVTRRIIDALDARDNIKETTRASYWRLLRPVHHNQLNDEAVMDWVSNIPNPNTKRATLIALRAVGYNYRGSKPKVTRGFPRVYDLPAEDELRLMFSYSRRYEVQFLSMMYLGLRLGEACIVNQTQLLPGSRIYINQQVAEWRECIEGTFIRKTSIRETKSTATVIDCPPWLAERLPKKPTPLVPTNVRAALHWTSNRYLGRTVNPHMLRHWYVTHMIESGVPLPVVQRQARHAYIQTTMVYTNLQNYRMTLFDTDMK